MLYCLRGPAGSLTARPRLSTRLACPRPTYGLPNAKLDSVRAHFSIFAKNLSDASEKHRPLSSLKNAARRLFFNPIISACFAQMRHAVQRKNVAPIGPHGKVQKWSRENMLMSTWYVCSSQNNVRSLFFFSYLNFLCPYYFCRVSYMRYSLEYFFCLKR